MSIFSASDAALTGFRVTTGQPKAIAFWAIGYLVVSLISALLLLSMGPELVQQMSDMARQDPRTVDPQAMIALYSRILPTYSLLMLISLVYYSIAQPAAYRIVLKPAQSSFGFMRLGADELRQFVVNIVLSVVLLAVYLAAALVVGLVVGAIQVMLGTSPAAQALGAMVAIILILGAFIAVAVRLSLAGPQTLAEGRIRLFDSWRLTKGRFWNIFGVYVLAFVMAVIVTLLGLVIIYGAAAALGGGIDGLRKLIRPDLTSAATYFTPLMILYTLLMSVISALGLAILLTPPAEIYRSLTATAVSDEGWRSARTQA